MGEARYACIGSCLYEGPEAIIRGEDIICIVCDGEAVRMAGRRGRLCPGCRSRDGEHNFGDNCTLADGGRDV